MKVLLRLVLLLVLMLPVVGQAATTDDMSMVYATNLIPATGVENPCLSAAYTAENPGLCAPAVADPTPIVDGDFGAAVALLQPIYKAVTDGNYFLAFALVLVLATFVVRTFLWKSIPLKWIPVVMPLSVGAAVLAAALTTGADPVTATLKGIEAGLAAVGLNQAWNPIKDKLGIKENAVFKP